MFLRKRVLPGAVLLYVGWVATAQAIVSVEDLHFSDPKSGFAGSIQASVAGESGNADKVSAAVASRVEWNAPARTSFGLFSYNYGESFDRKDTDKGFLHLRHIRGYAPQRAWEVFGQAQSNEFARLKLRALVGGGLRLEMIPRSDEQAAYWGIGGFYAEEKLEDAPGTGDEGSGDWWGNTYLLYKRRINAHVEFQSTTYFQPNLSDAEDYRLLEDAFLRVGMSEALALKLTLHVVHDSQPPEAVEKTDTTYATGLEYRF